MSQDLKSSTETAKSNAERLGRKRLKEHRKFVMMTKAEYEASQPEQIEPDNEQ